MYFNNVHILIYVAIAVAGFFIGKFVNWCNYRLPEYKKVFCKEMFKAKELEGYKTNYNAYLYYIIIFLGDTKNIFRKFKFNKIFNINSNVAICFYYRL